MTALVRPGDQRRDLAGVVVGQGYGVDLDFEARRLRGLNAPPG